MTEAMYCRCGNILLPSDSLKKIGYANIYECSKCGYPNHTITTTRKKK